MLIGNNYLKRPLIFSIAAYCPFALTAFIRAGAPEPNAPSAQGTVKELFRAEGKGFIAIKAIAPDGKTLVYTDKVAGGGGKPNDNDLILIDLDTGKELNRRLTEYVDVVAFSPDGKLLATSTPSSDTAVTVWDVAHLEPKIKLKRPKGYFNAWMLALSPDGKLLAASVMRDQRNGTPSIRGPLDYDLVVWDVTTGDCRVLKAGDQEDIDIVRKADNFRRTKELPLTGPFVGPPCAVSFPDNGATGQMFVESATLEAFTTVWDIAKGKPLRTEWGGVCVPSGHWFTWIGSPAPGSAAANHRFRTTPAGRLLFLPKYNSPPVIALPFADGTIAIAVRSSENHYGVVVPVDNFKFAELWRGDDYKGTNGVTCGLTADGKRLVAVGPDSKSPDPKNRLLVLRGAIVKSCG
jgi:WD40 repeat protein